MALSAPKTTPPLALFQHLSQQSDRGAHGAECARRRVTAPEPDHAASGPHGTLETPLEIGDDVFPAWVDEARVSEKRTRLPGLFTKPASV
jgi:hypothetical protein